MNPWAIATLTLFGVMMAAVIAAFLCCHTKRAETGQTLEQTQRNDSTNNLEVPKWHS